MKTKLIAFDLDGTVLHDDKKFGKATARALEAAAQKGIQIVPASGRLYMGMPEEIRKLPFIHYMIAVNGALVYDVREKKVLYQAEMEKDDVRQAFKELKDIPAICGCYQDNQGWMSREDYDKIDAYAFLPNLRELMKKIYNPVAHLEDTLLQSEHKVQKMMLFFADLEAREQAMKDLLEKFPNLAISSSLPNNIELNAMEANKGAALRFLCSYLGVDIKDSVAFGDGSNDLTMISVAGIGVAMGNACKDLLQVADEVAKSNEEDGVAEYIERCILGEKCT